MPDEFTHAVNRAMASSGFGDTSPGGCFTFPFPFCWDPTTYPREGAGDQGVRLFAAAYTLANGILLGAMLESRNLGGVHGWNAQAGDLNLSGEERNFALLAGFERPFSRTEGIGRRFHGRVAAGPALSRVKVLASRSNSSPESV